MSNVRLHKWKYGNSSSQESSVGLKENSRKKKIYVTHYWGTDLYIDFGVYFFL